MNIVEEDFKLEEDEGHWNLYLLQKIGGTNPREELQLEGYGYSIMGALKVVALNRMRRKKETYSLKEFLVGYKEETKKIRDLIIQADDLRDVSV